MDELGSLKLLSSGLDRQQWSQSQLRVVVETIVGVVAREQKCRQLKGLVMEICAKVSKRLSEEHRSRLAQVFRRESGDIQLLLRLYAILKVPCCLDILAGLVEAYARKPDFYASKVPKFQVLLCGPEDLLAVEHRAGAIFLAKPTPTSDLLQDYISQFLSISLETATLTCFTKNYSRRSIRSYFALSCSQYYSD